MTSVPSSGGCADGASLLAELRSVEGPVRRITVTHEGFDVEFVNGSQHSIAGLTFMADDDRDRQAVQTVVGRILREDWGASEPQIAKFFARPLIPGLWVDQSKFTDPPLPGLSLAVVGLALITTSVLALPV